MKIDQGYSCVQVRISHPDLFIRTPLGTDTLNFAPDSLICFLYFSKGFPFDLFKAKLEDEVSNAGGGGLFDGAGGGLFGGQPPPRYIGKF